MVIASGALGQNQTMKIVNQSHQILTDLSPASVEQMFSIMEQAGRVCYKSEDKIGLVACHRCNDKNELGVCRLNNWHKAWLDGLNPQVPSSFDFVSRILARGHESVIEHVNITVKFITDRGVTHELVRHRLASYSQESTRYCNYNNTEMQFINLVDRPVDSVDRELLGALEYHYKDLIESKVSPQQARAFLPNCLKTEILMTTNLREWRHVLKLRTSNAAHPQIRSLMTGLLEDFVVAIPIIFDEIWRGKDD